MNLSSFLSHLHSLDVQLWVDGDQLRCNAPENVLTPVLLEELKNRKTEILTLLTSAAGDRKARRRCIEKADRTSPLPLSFAQQRLWFLHQLEPTNTAYLMSSAFQIRGPLVLKALEASL